MSEFSLPPFCTLSHPVYGQNTDKLDSRMRCSFLIYGDDLSHNPNSAPARSRSDCNRSWHLPKRLLIEYIERAFPYLLNRSWRDLYQDLHSDLESHIEERKR